MKNLKLIQNVVYDLQNLEHDGELKANSLSKEGFFLLTALHNNQCHPEIYNAVVKQLLYIYDNLPNKKEVKHSLDLMESWVEVLIRTKTVLNNLADGINK
jgi:hypothetical protein